MPTYADYTDPPQRIPQRGVPGNNPTMKSVDILVRAGQTMWYPEEATDLSAWYNKGTFELTYTMPDGQWYTTTLKPANGNVELEPQSDKYDEPEKLSTLLEDGRVVLVTK